VGRACCGAVALPACGNIAEEPVVLQHGWRINRCVSLYAHLFGPEAAGCILVAASIISTSFSSRILGARGLTMHRLCPFPPLCVFSFFQGTVKEILGTAVSVGCTVNGRNPRDLQADIDDGKEQVPPQ
jgi:hypothetical protein